MQGKTILESTIVLSMYKNEHEYTDYGHGEIKGVIPVTIEDGLKVTLGTDYDGPVSVVTIEPAREKGFKLVKCMIDDRNQMSCEGSRSGKIDVQVMIPDRVRCDEGVPKSRTKFVCYKETDPAFGGGQLMGMVDNLMIADDILVNKKGDSTFIEIDPTRSDQMRCYGEVGNEGDTLYCSYLSPDWNV